MSKTAKQKLKALKDYFSKEANVLLAFVFGSQGKGFTHRHSDWDIAVYFKPKEYMEISAEEERYPREDGIWSDLMGILESDEVDFLVLNRARPDLVYTILKDGLALAVKDKKLYWDLLCKTSYEALDWWQFVDEFYQIRERAESLSPQDRKRLLEVLVFLEEEFKELGKFEQFSFQDYDRDADKRRIIERWVENLVMSALDIAKIILASEKKTIPAGYRETLERFFSLYVGSDGAKDFAQFAKLRNIVVHEYLDIRWARIGNFLKKAKVLYPQFIAAVKKMVDKQKAKT